MPALLASGKTDVVMSWSKTKTIELFVATFSLKSAGVTVKMVGGDCARREAVLTAIHARAAT